MGQIKVIYDLEGIEGLCTIESTLHGDNRGYFMETFSQKDMYEAGLYISFVQDNQSMSKKGVLRGLHFQKRFPQTKLVRVIKGTVYDVAVDLRLGSPTFGKFHGEILTADNRKQYLIPRGFAHGFLVMSDEAIFTYKVDNVYAPQAEAGIRWDDSELAIEWPIDPKQVSTSEKDVKQPLLKDAWLF